MADSWRERQRCSLVSADSAAIPQRFIWGFFLVKDHCIAYGNERLSSHRRLLYREAADLCYFERSCVMKFTPHAADGTIYLCGFEVTKSNLMSKLDLRVQIESKGFHCDNEFTSLFISCAADSVVCKSALVLLLLLN